MYFILFYFNVTIRRKTSKKSNNKYWCSCRMKDQSILALCDSVIVDVRCAAMITRRFVTLHVNTFYAACMSRRQVKNFTKVLKIQNSGICWLYLESPWKMHLIKYKHAWYLFQKLWHFKNFEKQNDLVWILKPISACKVIKEVNRWKTFNQVLWCY